MRGVEALIRPPAQFKGIEPGWTAFEIPLIPPSVNHYKQPGRIRGTWYITKEAQAFIDAVCMIGRNAARVLPIIGKFYYVEVTVYVSEKKFLRGDSDNMEKVLFDALTKAGLIKDDRYITRHTNNRVPVALAQEERTVYRIYGREEP